MLTLIKLVIIVGALFRVQIIGVAFDTPTLLCSKGEYLINNNHGAVCLPCQQETFMPDDKHQHTECAKCSEPEEYTNEIEVKQCSAVQDTVIGCRDGYFLTKDYVPGAYYAFTECKRCTDCGMLEMYEGKPCGKENDAVCCPNPNMRVVANEDAEYTCE